MYVMTAAAGESIAASTLTWLSQCSFRPPLVMMGIQAQSRMRETVEAAGSLAIHILGEHQREIAETFFKPRVVEEGRLGGWAFARSPLTGAPLLADPPAWFEARVTDAVHRGDHSVFVAEVIQAGLRDPAAAPLLLAHTSWNYGG
jgi:flavin reductase (DIM6/NTAB) family NADH-FMN oxidoreductase RutF